MSMVKSSTKERTAILVGEGTISEVAYSAIGELLIESGEISSFKVIRDSSLWKRKRELFKEVILSSKEFGENCKLALRLLEASYRYAIGSDRNFSALAEARLHGIQIGDVVIACNGRTIPKSRLSVLRGLVWCYIQALRAFYGFRELSLDKYDLIGVWEPNYFSKLLCRLALNENGLDYLRVNNYPGMAIIYNMNGSHAHSVESLTKQGLEAEITEAEGRRASEYIKCRLEDISRIDYMETVSAKEDASMEKILNNVEIVRNKTNLDMLEESGRVAIIYMHSFSDAQLEHGWDGFCSCYTWMVEAIEMCQEVGMFTFLKPHPSWKHIWGNSVHSTSRLDLEYLKHINTYLRGKVRIGVLPMSTRPSEIIRLLGAHERLHISHHGTVIPELAFLGEETLSSSVSAWGDIQQFSSVYSSPAEMREKIRRFWERGACSKNDQKTILRFIYNHYLRKDPYIDGGCESIQGAIISTARLLESCQELEGLTDREVAQAMGSRYLVQDFASCSDKAQKLLVERLRMLITRYCVKIKAG